MVGRLTALGGVGEDVVESEQAAGHEVRDFGTNSEEACDYPVYIRPAAEAVLAPWSTEGARSFIPGIFFIVSGLLVGLFGILFPS